MLEEERLKKEEDERLAIEEIKRLENEEYILKGWKTNFDNKLYNSMNEMNEYQDWNKYSNCAEGYINVRKEKDLNGFIYEFKEKSGSVIYNIIYSK